MPRTFMASMYPSSCRAQPDCIWCTVTVPEDNTALPSCLMKLTAYGIVQPKDLVESLVACTACKNAGSISPSLVQNIIPSIKTSLISFQYTNNPTLKMTKKHSSPCHCRVAKWPELAGDPGLKSFSV